MNAPGGLDLASIPERIQSEVQRAIQRSIKGVEYISSSGPSLGSTPKDILSVRGTMNLYHYRPIVDEIYRVPILIVMATTNRGYILDMVPGQSFIEFLLKRGYDVYMLDWTAPKPEEKSLRMEDYVLDFIPDCIRRVQQDSGEQDVSVIGYCFGGVLSLLYGSIFSDGPMKNLICFTTPVDFREMKLFHNFADRRYFDVDRLVDSVGNLPPEMILSSFEMLRPASRAASQVQLWENIWNDEYVKSYRMFDRWATDILPLAGEYFRTITKDLMWGNKLFHGTMSVGGHAADISQIKVPILHAVAEHDHIVPYDAAKHLIPNVGSTDKEEVMLKGGHVSLVAGPNAIKRLWPKLELLVRWKIDMTETRSYPRHVKTDAGDIELRKMSRADEPAVLAFAQKLPTHDLLFLPRNISQPKVLSAWINEIERGAITSLLAVKNGKVVGCGTLVRDPHSWSPHVGEIRMVVSQDVRGQGVGRALSQETFALALGAGLEKLSVQMTVDQQAAIELFESLGFKAEALLRDHVRDVDGKKHDIVVLGHNVAQVRAQMEAYGLPGAVQGLAEAGGD